jgi:hypothetical protein
MKDHKGDFRAFCHGKRAYWRSERTRPRGELDVVYFGFYSPKGGTSGEMVMQWKEVGGKPTPQLKAFCDSWHALNEMKDLLAALAEVDDEDISPERFCKMLLDLGFKDRTETTRP